MSAVFFLFSGHKNDCNAIVYYTYVWGNFIFSLMKNFSDDSIIAFLTIGPIINLSMRKANAKSYILHARAVQYGPTICNAYVMGGILNEFRK